MPTTDQIHEMTRGYITAALWADCERMCDCCPLTPFVSGIPSGPPIHADGCATNESGGLEHLDVRAEDYAYVFALCSTFTEQAGSDLATFAQLRSFDPAEGTVWEHIGHDLRLTSGGHGTGFWDRSPRSDLDYSASNPVAVAFSNAQRNLSDIAQSRPFDRSGGGDCWQVDADTAGLEHYSLDANAAPGAHWEAPALTSAQRQCWIESGVVPTVDETFPVGDAS